MSEFFQQESVYSMNIKALFTEPSKQMHPVLRYGILAFILVLLANDIRWRLRLSPNYPYERYSNGVVALMLLFNHLAFQFRWPTRVTVALRALAFGWLMFGLIYIFCQ